MTSRVKGGSPKDHGFLHYPLHSPLLSSFLRVKLEGSHREGCMEKVVGQPME